MPSVNPPVDAARAETDPDLVLACSGAVALVGPHGSSTAGCAWRYAVLVMPDGSRFTGYLWET
jgi:hypothetical protein